VCGTRDYWAGSGTACLPADKGRPTPSVTLDDALERFRRDLDAFGAWWDRSDLGPERPTLPEWWAEFDSWRRQGRA